MKKYIKRIFLPLMLTAVMTLSGCSLFGKKKDKELDVFKYSFANYDKNYLVNENFSFDGMVLEIIYEDGTVKQIAITENMIVSKPDMSTPGTKVVVVKYDGEEFTFEIIVEENTNSGVEQNFLNQLKSFLDNYKGANDSLKVDVTADVFAKYLEEESKLEDYQIEFLLKEVLPNVDVTSDVYNAIFDSIVNESFDVEIEDVLDSTGMKTKLDMIETLGGVLNELADINYGSYLINYLIPSEDDSEVIATITDVLDNLFEIDVDGRLALEEFVEENYYNLKDGKIQPIGDLVSDLFDIVSEYSCNEKIKETIDAISNFDTDNLKTELSKVIEINLSHNLMIVTKEAYADYLSENVQGYADPVGLDNANASYILNGIVEKTVAVFETTYDFYESLVVNKAQNSKELLLESIDALISGADFMTTAIRVMEENDWILVSYSDYEWDSIMVTGLGCSQYNNEPWVCEFELDYQENIENFQSMKNDYEDIKMSVTTDGFAGLLEYVDLNTGNAFVDELIKSGVSALESNEPFVKALLDGLFVEEDSYYVEEIVEFLADAGQISNVLGKDELTSVVTKHFDKFRNSQDLSIEEALTDVLEVIEDYTTSDEIKSTLKSLNSRDLDEVKNIFSDLLYIQYVNDHAIATVENYEIWRNSYWNSYDDDIVLETSNDATALVKKYAKIYSDRAKLQENLFIDLLTVKSFADLETLLVNYLQALKGTISEDISLYQALEAKQWVIGYLDDESYFHVEMYTDYYPHWDSDEEQWEGEVDVSYDTTEFDELLNTFDQALEIVELTFDFIENPHDTISSKVEEYRSEILEELNALVEAEFENEDLIAELKVLVEDSVDDVIAQSLSIEELVDRIYSLIEDYGSEDLKTFVDAVGVVYNVLNYDSSIDYNEMFKDLPLPEEIESIDYNKLLEKLHDENTYDFLHVSNWEVTYVTNAQDKIVGEVLTLNINLDFDAVIASIQGDIKLEIRLDF